MAKLAPRLALYLSAVSIIGWAPSNHAGMPHPTSATSASASASQNQSDTGPAPTASAPSSSKHPPGAAGATGSASQKKSGTATALPASTPYTRKKVMDPNKFFGKPRLAYMAAQKIPDTIEHLFCYCGCDLPEADRHTSLLDCYTCNHGADCDICTGEVLLALRLKTEGKSLAEIQRAVDTQFSRERDPSFEITDALRKYRASIGIKPSAASVASPKKSTSNTAPKPHKCCGHSNK